jgi:hypothetical protein
VLRGGSFINNQNNARAVNRNNNNPNIRNNNYGVRLVCVPMTFSPFRGWRKLSAPKSGMCSRMHT